MVLSCLMCFPGFSVTFVILLIVSKYKMHAIEVGYDWNSFFKIFLEFSLSIKLNLAASVLCQNCFKQLCDIADLV